MAGYSGSLIKVIAVAGPTATGKTQAAAELAKRVGGEVICADSMQIYKRLDIGTAKPTAEEMGGVPHHMYSIIEPSERYSVARYISEASEMAREIHSRGKVPILCGGTGLYISSFANGISFNQSGEDSKLRHDINAEFETKGGQALIDEIAEKEPDFAAALHLNDKKRIVRAVELLRTCGYTIPKQNELSRSGDNKFSTHLAIMNCSDRKIMYNRINARVDAMIAGGLLDEARYVFENRDMFQTAAQAIGYKELFGYFDGTSNLENCVEKLKQATRNYAKRQLTWFRREEGAMWFTVDDAKPAEIAERAAIWFETCGA